MVNSTIESTKNGKIFLKEYFTWQRGSIQS